MVADRGAPRNNTPLPPVIGWRWRQPRGELVPSFCWGHPPRQQWLAHAVSAPPSGVRLGTAARNAPPADRRTLSNGHRASANVPAGSRSCRPPQLNGRAGSPRRSATSARSAQLLDRFDLGSVPRAHRTPCARSARAVACSNRTEVPTTHLRRHAVERAPVVGHRHTRWAASSSNPLRPCSIVRYTSPLITVQLRPRRQPNWARLRWLAARFPASSTGIGSERPCRPASPVLIAFGCSASGAASEQPLRHTPPPVSPSTFPTTAGLTPWIATQLGDHDRCTIDSVRDANRASAPSGDHSHTGQRLAQQNADIEESSAAIPPTVETARDEHRSPTDEYGPVQMAPHWRLVRHGRAPAEVRLPRRRPGQQVRCQLPCSQWAWSATAE